jgi:hypothetical protein
LQKDWLMNEQVRRTTASWFPEHSPVLFRVLVHARRGRRDSASVSLMRPSRYDVAADETVADQAVRLLAELPTGTGTGTSGGARKGPQSGPAVT